MPLLLRINPVNPTVENTMEPERDPLERISEIVASKPEKSTAFLSVVSIIGSTLRRVLAAEKACEASSISLAQREALIQMRKNTSLLIEALGEQLPGQVSLAKVPADKENSWWFALSEVTHILEESIEQLSSLVSRQEKKSAARDLTAIYVRQLRRHYNFYLAQADQWMDG